MSYCTKEQLVERYGEQLLVQLTDRAEEATGEIVDDVVARAIADTSALIDGYLKTRYQLPLPSTPPLLVDLALQIAIYKLHLNIASEKISNDYRDAMKMLREIASGDLRLDVEGAEPAGSDAAGDVRTNDPPRPMTGTNMKGYV